MPDEDRAIRIDHETGMIHGLPGGPQPLVGPTSGRAYEDLKRAEEANEQRKRIIKRQILSTYQCLQCKRKFPGRIGRAVLRKEQGVMMEVIVCPDQACDGPSVMVEDALSLRHPPSQP